jgi:hypothetical protein
LHPDDEVGCAEDFRIRPRSPVAFDQHISWAGLLLVLPLVWNAAHNSPWPRLGLIALGGLSSPIIVPLSALLVLRAVLERQRTEWIIAAVAVGIAALQLVPILNYTSVDDATVLSWAIWKLPGYAVFPRAPSDHVAIPTGIAASLAFGAAVIALRPKLDRYFWLLLMAALLIAAITFDSHPSDHNSSGWGSSALFLLSLCARFLAADLDRRRVRSPA